MSNNVVVVGKLRKDVIVGLDEQAGTGIPKILHGWQIQHWSPSNLHESVAHYNQTPIVRTTPAPHLEPAKDVTGAYGEGEGDRSPRSGRHRDPCLSHEKPQWGAGLRSEVKPSTLAMSSSATLSPSSPNGHGDCSHRA